VADLARIGPGELTRDERPKSVQIEPFGATPAAVSEANAFAGTAMLEVGMSIPFLTIAYGVFLMWTATTVSSTRKVPHRPSMACAQPLGVTGQRRAGFYSRGVRSKRSTDRTRAPKPIPEITPAGV
jgi:hypothetical protein